MQYLSSRCGVLTRMKPLPLLQRDRAQRLLAVLNSFHSMLLIVRTRECRTISTERLPVSAVHTSPRQRLEGRPFISATLFAVYKVQEPCELSD